MTNQRLQADVITYSVTINASEKGMQWQRSLGWLEEWSKDGFQADAILCYATVSACARGEQ